MSNPTQEGSFCLSNGEGVITSDQSKHMRDLLEARQAEQFRPLTNECRTVCDRQTSVMPFVWMAFCLLAILMMLLLTGCASQCKPVTVPVPVYCAAPLPPPPAVDCPALDTPAAVVRCGMARDKAQQAYAAALAAALKACRKPTP